MVMLLALDPGKMTGWSFWRLPDDAPLEHVDHGMIPGGIKGFLAWWHESMDEHLLKATVVSETFVLDGRTLKPDTTPLLVEGALHALVPGWIGQRNVCKASAPDEKLKEWGLWWPGRGHDRDSARHAIHYAKSIKHMPTIMKFWPPRSPL